MEFIDREQGRKSEIFKGSRLPALGGPQLLRPKGVTQKAQEARS